MEMSEKIEKDFKELTESSGIIGAVKLGILPLSAATAILGPIGLLIGGMAGAAGTFGLSRYYVSKKRKFLSNLEQAHREGHISNERYYEMRRILDKIDAEGGKK